MKINELLLERRQQPTAKYYHGTTTNFLRSILKVGLLPDSGNKSFGTDDPGRESFTGVYFSPDREYATMAAENAVNVHDGEPMLITINYVSKSGSIDEDHLSDLIIKYVRQNYRTYINDNDRFMRQLIKLVKDAVPFAKFKFRNEQLLHEVVISIYEILLSKKISPTTENILSNQSFRTALNNLAESLKAGLPGNTQPKPTLHRGSIKISRPIKFKGKTRITKIENINTGKVYYNHPE